MNVINWLTGHFSNRGKALSLYKRGMVKAKKHDHQGAIDDYTVIIGMPDTPGDVKAMALYNRALVQVAVGDDQNGIVDLDAILAMDEAPVNIKSEVKRKRERMNRQQSKIDLQKNSNH